MWGHYPQQTKSGKECHSPRNSFVLFAQHFKRASWRRNWAILPFLAKGANWYAQRWVASLCQIKVSICSLQHCLPQAQRLQSQRPWNLELAWLCTVWQALQGFISRPGRVHLQWEFSSPTSRVSGAFINSSAAFIQHMHCFTSMYVWPPCLELFELPELRSKFKMMDSFRNLPQQTVYFN